MIEEIPTGELINFMQLYDPKRDGLISEAKLPELNVNTEFQDEIKIKHIQAIESVIFSNIKESKFELGILELINKVVWLINNSPAFIKILSILIYFITKGKTMWKDPKTTITAIAKFIVLVLGIVGVAILPEQQELIITFGLSLYGVISLIQGMFTKDVPKT